MKIKLIAINKKYDKKYGLFCDSQRNVNINYKWRITHMNYINKLSC